MPGPFTKFEAAFFFIYGIIIIDLCWNWKDYSSCQAPIDYFLLGTYLIIPIQALTWTFMAHPRTPAWLARVLTFFFFAGLGPCFFLLSILGIKYQVEDIDYTPDCIPAERAPWTVWGWILLLLLEDIIYTAIIVFTVISWYRWFRYTRRMRRLMNNLANMDGQNLNEYLLGLNGEYGDLNNQVGLSKGDLNQLKGTPYTQSFGSLLSVQQPSCPICFEDFSAGDDVIDLPSCNHLYHTQCIKVWLEKNPLCPMCRSNVRNNHYHSRVADNNKEVNAINNC